MKLIRELFCLHDYRDTFIHLNGIEIRAEICCDCEKVKDKRRTGVILLALLVALVVAVLAL